MHSDRVPDSCGGGFKTHVGMHFSHASGKDAHAPVFYLQLEPDNCFAAAGVWHPDNSALTKIRMAIVAEPDGVRWARKRPDYSETAIGGCSSPIIHSARSFRQPG